MRLGSRRARLIVAVLILLLLPLGQAGGLLALVVAVDLAAAARRRPDEPPAAGPVVTLAGDATRLALLRRTVPTLRMRRPPATVEAQMRWRAAAQGERSAKSLMPSAG